MYVGLFIKFQHTLVEVVDVYMIPTLHKITRYRGHSSPVVTEHVRTIMLHIAAKLDKALCL